MRSAWSCKLCQEGADAWAKKTGNEVKVISTPNSATERLALYQQLLAAKSPDIDVFQIDVIWPGILANHFIDLTGKIPADEVNQHFKAIVENNTVGGKLVAMPWFTDAGMLYYRKDLLETARQAAAADLAGADRRSPPSCRPRRAPRATTRMWGYVFQGKAYEGLTCNALEWVDSFGGGQIVDADGKITVDNPKAAEALTWAATTVGKIAPEGVLELQRGRGARRVPVGQRRLHAQLALRLGAGAGRGQPDQGQDRRGGPARRRRRTASGPARWAAGSWPSRPTASIRISPPTSSAT